MSVGARTGFFAVVVAFVAMLSWGLETHLSDPLHRSTPAAVPPDPAGRPLYLLLVDSLSPKDVETMAGVGALREGGFSAVVEPCADNYTYPCTYEALTGRSTFSLFSFLDNMGVLERDSGANLITDAVDAGWEVAVISRKDMDAWGAQATKNIHVSEPRRSQELEVALDAAAKHQLVFHHYVWHDVVSHRYPVGTPEYARSLEELEAFIVGLEAGLPEGMDLLITGDHGHLDDGRHLQGLDTPTEVILRSPNVVPQRISGRIPISSMRWLAAAVTGIGSSASRVAPEWREWLGPALGEGLRTSGEPVDRTEDGGGLPWLALGGALLLGVAATGALGWQAGVAVALWGLLMGLAYPSVHEANLAGHGPRAVMFYTIGIPGVGGLVWLARRRTVAAGWWGVVAVAVAFGLALFPVRGPEGVLRNAETVLIPGMVAAAIACAWWARAEPERRRWSQLAWAGLLVGGAWLSSLTLSFKANDVRLIALPMWWLHRDWSAWLLPMAVASAGAIQALVRPRPVALVAAMVALPLGTVLPVPLQALAFVATTVAIVFLRGVPRDTWLVPLLTLCCGFMFTKVEAWGILLSSLVAAGAMAAALAVQRGRPEAEAREAVSWMGALSLAFGAYTGMAWTLRLSVAGIDFGFILKWLPDGWHETLWWLITAGVFVKTFVPVMLVHAVVLARRPALAGSMVERSFGIAVLRAVLTCLFSVGWVLSQGPSAGTRRLIRVLQEGYGWLFIALALLMLLTVHRWRPRGRTAGGAAATS
jgi:hypothetical protein